MDLNGFSYAACFAPPHCFELCGQQYTISLTEANDKSGRISLMFKDSPSKELTITGEMLTNGTFVYDCAKVSDGSYFISYRCDNSFISFVIDIPEKLAVLTIAAVDSDFSFSSFFGTTDGSPEHQHKAISDDFVGNSAVWTFGPAEGDTVNIKYNTNSAEVVYQSHQINDAIYGAYHIHDTVYFQYVYMEIYGTKQLFTLLCDYTNMIGAGAVFEFIDTETRYKKIGCYGKLISYTEESD